VSMLVHADETHADRLVLAKEICPDVVLIVGITNANLQEDLAASYLPAQSIVFFSAGNNHFLSLGEGKILPEFNKTADSFIFSDNREKVAYLGEKYFYFENSIADGTITQSILIPDEISNSRGRAFLMTTLLHLLILFLLGGVASYMLAARLYEPVEEVIKKLPAQEDVKTPNEFILIDQVLKDFQQKLSYSERQLAWQNKTLADGLLLRLMKRDVLLNQAVLSTLEKAGFPVDVKKFAVLMIQSLTDIVSEEPNVETSAKLYRKALIERGYDAYIVENLNCFIAVMKIAEEEKWDTGKLEAMQTSFERYAHQPVNVVSSEVHTGMTRIADAYEEASQVFEYNMMVGEFGTVKSFPDYFGHITDSYDHMTSYKLIGKMIELNNNIQEEKYDATILSIRDTFEIIVTETIARIKTKRSGNIDEKRRIDKIVQYIQKNYTDPNISARSVAEHFDISISWMSNLFKRELNIGFLDCLHRYRIDEAKTLIGNTDESIHKIAEKVGYANYVTMSRAFKRYEGVTPRSYRAHMDE